MESLLTDFTRAVSALNAVLDDLAELSQEKQQLIILGKVKELDTLIRKEGILISNLEKTEGARFKLQEQIGQSWGISGGELSAREILKRVEETCPTCYHDLEQAINRLDYNLTRLGAINAHNNELIEQSLDYIKVIETTLNGDTAGTYSSNGNQITEGNYALKNLLDKKI
ncbi:MAG: flagellar protein FlgN [Methanocorpusculum sp.]|nr:flagellar protein FlgN [Methanocorpusculum sp.]